MGLEIPRYLQAHSRNIMAHSLCYEVAERIVDADNLTQRYEASNQEVIGTAPFIWAA